jgi:hypothetical protein
MDDELEADCRLVVSGAYQIWIFIIQSSQSTLIASDSQTARNVIAMPPSLANVVHSILGCSFHIIQVAVYVYSPRVLPRPCSCPNLSMTRSSSVQPLPCPLPAVFKKGGVSAYTSPVVPRLFPRPCSKEDIGAVG